MTYHWICNKIYTKGATYGAGTAYPSGAPEFTPGFWWCSCCWIFSFPCNVLYIVVCPFSFGRRIVCPPIYDSWLPLSIYKLFNYHTSRQYSNGYGQKITSHCKEPDVLNTRSLYLRPILRSSGDLRTVGPTDTSFGLMYSTAKKLRPISMPRDCFYSLYFYLSSILENKPHVP